MLVPYNYLPFEFKNTKNIFSQWKKLIRTTDFTLGKKMLEFEKKFAKYVGAKYCIATNNGTDALILSLKSLGIQKDDEIITVCNSFYATVGAIVACGAKPVLVDCDERYQINYNKIIKKITKRTKVIIPVHWGGASPEMKKIMQIAKKYKIKVVEDACMGIGGKLHKKSPGTFGIVNAFSMHPLKSLNVMGDGGMVVTNSKKIYNWMLKYRNHGMISRDYIDFWGLNMRLQPLQAIVAIVGLKKIDKVIKKRNKNAEKLDKELKKLSPHIILPNRIKGYFETFALYMILVEKRDRLLKYLHKKKIEAKVHYPIPLNKQKASKIYNYDQNDFLIANQQAKKLITLPVHQYLTSKQLDYMIRCVTDFYQKKIN
jgi:dTDP-3-amino-2,3,6-trideoxy-4-keto-D-glucose/dTDP-3-amino-3,4,6-trideoxy-alpha-D-glucose/dTDP-2,6-dideoxy-D-kanosamine transaminase